MLEQVRQTLNEFKVKASAFMDEMAKLQAASDRIERYPALKNDYDSLILKGGVIETTVRSVAYAIKKALSWVDIDASDYLPQNLNAIQLIPVAAVSGAIAAIGYWLNGAYKLNKRIEYADKLVAQGVPPERAAQLATKMDPGVFTGIGENILKPLIPLGIIALVFIAKQKRLI